MKVSTLYFYVVSQILKIIPSELFLSLYVELYAPKYWGQSHRLHLMLYPSGIHYTQEDTQSSPECVKDAITTLGDLVY